MCFRLAPRVLYFRGTFEMWQEVHGEALSTGTIAQISSADIFSSRAMVFPMEGQSAKPVLVAKMFLISSLLGPSWDLIYTRE